MVTRPPDPSIGRGPATGTDASGLAELLRGGLELFDEPVWERAASHLERETALEDSQPVADDRFRAAESLLISVEPDLRFPLLGVDHYRSLMVTGRITLLSGARPVVRIVLPEGYPSIPARAEALTRDGFLELPLGDHPVGSDHAGVVLERARQLLERIGIPA